MHEISLKPQMTEKELKEFEEIVAEVATGGLLITVLEVGLCLFLKNALSAIWILITAL